MDKMQELGRSRKQHSLTFSVNEGDTSQDIIVGFDKTGIDIGIMISIQRKASNNTWVASFDSKEANDAALNEPWFTIAMSFGGTARTRFKKRMHRKIEQNRQIVATAQNLTYPHFKSVIRF